MMRARESPAAAEATRGQLLGLMRQGTWTVDELALKLDLTDNAVRFHLASLEAEHTVERRGVRKGAGAGQPAVLFGLTAAAEEAFSRAYAPVLAACVVELRETMSKPQLLAFLKRVGRRIARGNAAAPGPLAKRAASASRVLNELGGITSVEKSGDTYNIVGTACPLASAVKADNCVCVAVTALVADIVGAQVRERCDRSGQPRCCFEITSAPADGAADPKRLAR
jgi:predicted ArsR family transcriptional regulator